MIQPGKLDITIQRGVTAPEIQLQCLDEAGAHVDLTGYQPHAHARQRPGGPLVVDLHPVISSGSQWTIIIPEISDETTLVMTKFNGRWDLVLEDPTGKRLPPIVTGFFKVEDVITQPI